MSDGGELTSGEKHGGIELESIRKNYCTVLYSKLRVVSPHSAPQNWESTHNVVYSTVLYCTYIH